MSLEKIRQALAATGASAKLISDESAVLALAGVMIEGAMCLVTRQAQYLFATAGIRQSVFGSLEKAGDWTLVDDSSGEELVRKIVQLLRDEGMQGPIHLDVDSMAAPHLRKRLLRNALDLHPFSTIGRSS